MKIKFDESVPNVACNFNLRHSALVWFAWDDPTEYASWSAGEEHLMGVSFPVDTYAQTFGALVVYDTVGPDR